MNYKIGDMIETKHGKGIVIDILGNKLSVAVDFKVVEVDKPYKTAHDKLLELGWFKDNENEDRIILRNNDSGVITIYNDNTISTNEYITLQLSKILTQYLEELENE